MRFFNCLTTSALFMIVVGFMSLSEVRPASETDRSQTIIWRNPSSCVTLMDLRSRKTRCPTRIPASTGARGTPPSASTPATPSPAAVSSSTSLPADSTPSSTPTGRTRSAISPGPTRANPAGWQFNTYNRLSFWIKRPTSAAPPGNNGNSNVEFGTYVKQITKADGGSDETGGNHYYHMLDLPNNGQWTYVIINMHPSHYRSEVGGEDPGNIHYPTATNGPNGGGDPPSTYNYFDSLTRFYIDDTLHPRTGTYLLDDFQFYQETVPENDVQVYSLTANYDPSRNRLIVTWSRLKNENSIVHEVRYAFSDIHQLGWSKAKPAPRGSIRPLGWQGYNGMVYITQALPLIDHSVVYIAIKPKNSQRFSQIALPLNRQR